MISCNLITSQAGIYRPYSMRKNYGVMPSAGLPFWWSIFYRRLWSVVQQVATKGGLK